MEIIVPGGSRPDQPFRPAVQASRSISIGQIRIDQPMGEDLPTIGLLQRSLQMGRIRRGSQQVMRVTSASASTRSSPAWKLSRASEKLITCMVLSNSLIIN